MEGKTREEEGGKEREKQRQRETETETERHAMDTKRRKDWMRRKNKTKECRDSVDSMDSRYARENDRNKGTGTFGSINAK